MPLRVTGPGAGCYEPRSGRVAEWFKAAVLKTAVGGSSPWVRIPPRPPHTVERIDLWRQMPKHPSMRPTKGKRARARSIKPGEPVKRRSIILRVFALGLSGLGVFGTLYAAAEAYADVTKEPEISVTGSNPAAPLHFPFHLKNDAKYVTIKIDQITCTIEDYVLYRVYNGEIVGSIQGGLISGEIGVEPQDIPAGDSANAQCVFQLHGLLDHGKLTVSVRYSVLGRDRETSETFSWVNSGSDSKWIEGNLVRSRGADDEGARRPRPAPIQP